MATPSRHSARAALISAALSVCAASPADHRGGTLLLSAGQAAGTIDPQISYETAIWQILFCTQDGLLAFRHVSGPAGFDLVPDLAEAMPLVEDGGRSYVFTLRRGIRFSTGAEVAPHDVVASYRRMFKVLGPNAGSWYAAIVGADACVASPATCTLAGGIEADDRTSTIRIHLTHPSGEFLQQIALPFASILPADTPAHDLGTTPPAATGPYMIASYDPARRMRLERNPYFREWSRDAQPDGYVDAIDYRFGLENEAEVTAVERGSIDWMYDEKPLDRLDEIGRRYPRQAHIDPLLAYYYLFLGNHLPPFDRLAARQAVEFAVNRRALANLYGGPALAIPLCQALPRGLPGHEDTCPYTQHPGATWSAPDLARARDLVRASGTRGADVTLVTSDKEVERSMGLYLQSVLADIGYRAHLRTVSANIADTYLQNSANRVQAGLAVWYQDYPAASDFLAVLFSCASIHLGSDASINMSEFCDRRIDAEMARALALGAADPGAAASLWARIDREITDQAPSVTLFQLNYLDIVSPRFGNFVFHPLFHVLFSQAWVR